MANVVIPVKSFSSPYEDKGVYSASTDRRILTANIQDIEAYTTSKQPAIKSIIRVKYVSGRELKSGAYLVNDTVAALTTAINS